jgi:hypothetical protein
LHAKADLLAGLALEVGCGEFHHRVERRAIAALPSVENCGGLSPFTASSTGLEVVGIVGGNHIGSTCFDVGEFVVAEHLR